ncbi:MAG TPA: hypothetical protein PLY87_26930, partial [Planctomycetaceae bacterium]|nr:hypothetical protein [Planctomycetaceae bacterium]
MTQFRRFFPFENGKDSTVDDRKLGIREDEAVTHGISSNGPWAMSSGQDVHKALFLLARASPATQSGMLNGDS